MWSWDDCSTLRLGMGSKRRPRRFPTPRVRVSRSLGCAASASSIAQHPGVRPPDQRLASLSNETSRFEALDDTTWFCRSCTGNRVLVGERRLHPKAFRSGPGLLSVGWRSRWAWKQNPPAVARIGSRQHNQAEGDRYVPALALLRSRSALAVDHRYAFARPP